jgi:hypothetical protein
LEPYKPELLAPAFAGLIMCFFGGSFLTLIAAAEAYKLCGYESTIQALTYLKEDFLKVIEVNKHDDAKDDDNDGVADVLQITPSQLATRKVMIFFKSVDPKRLTFAISALNAGFLAVVATLKLQFAKAITLGHAIGSIIEVPAKRFALPALTAVLPDDYKKWAEPSIEYIIQSISISIAWSLQRVISAFHSAIRGGLLFSRNILEYLSIMKYVEIDHNDTYIDEIVGFGKYIIILYY